MRRDVWRNFDYWLFGTVVILILIGIAMIRSAIAGSPGLAGIEQDQAVFAVLGLIGLLVLAAIDYRYWSALTRVMYIAAVVALIGIYIVGEAVFGSSRWFNLGGISIQPSELAKIVMILVLADYFARSKDKEHDLAWIGKSLLLTMGVVVWILLQPNLSTSILLIVIWAAMLWISGLKIKYILTFGLVGTVLVLGSFQFWPEYQQERVFNFLTSGDEEDARYGETYNVEQALISIGSGGLTGQGYGQGTQIQLRFLKVRHTDFIFSVMAHEFGFVGTAVVILMLIFVVLRYFYIARTASDMFGALIAYGFGFLIFFQMSVNIGVNLRLLPVTGLTLPFISYGGSSLFSLLVGIGLVESVAAHRYSTD